MAPLQCSGSTTIGFDLGCVGLERLTSRLRTYLDWLRNRPDGTSCQPFALSLRVALPWNLEISLPPGDEMLVEITRGRIARALQLREGMRLEDLGPSVSVVEDVTKSGCHALVIPLPGDADRWPNVLCLSNDCTLSVGTPAVLHLRLRSERLLTIFNPEMFDFQLERLVDIATRAADETVRRVLYATEKEEVR